MSGYNPVSDEWSFKRHNENTIVIQNGKNWTLLTRDRGPVYEQFLYRFCEQKMDAVESEASVNLALIDALVKIKFRCECFIEDERSMNGNSIQAINTICEEAIEKARGQL